MLGVSALAFAATAWGQARPTTLKIVSGVCEVRNVVYAANTPAELSQPASGTGELTVIVQGHEFKQPGVPFSNVVTDASGKVTALAISLAEPFHLTELLGPGTDLEIPAGQISYVLPDKLTIQGQGTLTTPFRTKSGSPLQATVKSLRGSVDTSGLAKLNLDELALKGEAVQDGLTFPGINIKAAPLNVELRWAPSQNLSWNIKVPTAQVNLGIPGVACEPDYPFRSTVTNLAVNQDATVSFDEANITAGNGFKVGEASGFDLTIQGGKVRMVNSIPVFTAVVVDVTLPQGVTEDANNSTNRAKITGLTVSIDGGLLVSADQITGAQATPKFKVGGIRFSVSGFGLDLSNTQSLAGAQGPAAAPAWMGLSIKDGTASVPVGTEPLTLSCKDFLVEAQGVTGTATLAPGDRKLGGFTLKGSSGQFALVRNQITKGDLTGKVGLTGLGEIDASTTFDLEGHVAFAVSSTQPLKFGSVGVNIDQLKGQYDSGFLVLSGELGLDTTRIQALPDGFKQLKIGITDMRVDPTGKLHLPAGGFITFPDPKPVEVGPLGIEVRRIGFTTENDKLASVTFSGGACLKGLNDVLPIAGELDFEGLTISDNNGTPKAELGGIGFEAEMPGIGKIGASLARLNSDALPQGAAATEDVFAGDATLVLTCLPVGNVGIGLEFMVAPARPAFFIGGNVQLPTPILVQIPPAPPAIPTPIPLFHIMGFSGGFGFNVATIGEGQGRITDPLTQLKLQNGGGLLQIGLLLADPIPGAPGHLWWADTALTGTINPVTIDLTARAVFLDPGNPVFFDDIADWQKLDRIASIFLNIDFTTPAFTIGGDADLTFPSRSANLIAASGEAKMRVAADESFLRVGWREAGQKPLKVSFAQAFEGVADISAKAGLEIVLPKFDSQGRVTRAATAGLYLDAIAKIQVPGALIDGRLLGELGLNGVGSTSGFNADGKVALSAIVDFGLFSASAESDLNAFFNTASHRDELFLSGSVKGKAGPFEGSVPFSLALPVKKT
jgi:hypothetical protein